MEGPINPADFVTTPVMALRHARGELVRTVYHIDESIHALEVTKKDIQDSIAVMDAEIKNLTPIR